MQLGIYCEETFVARRRHERAKHFDSYATVIIMQWLSIPGAAITLLTGTM